MQIQPVFAKRRARIEIIPLIDIIFFLLATFVMVSLSMIKNQGIQVKLPNAVTGTVQDRTVSSTITVKENGEIYFDKEKIGEQELHSRLTRLKSENPDQKIILNGDHLAYFGDIVTVLDNVRETGIDKIAIQTKGGTQPAAAEPLKPAGQPVMGAA